METFLPGEVLVKAGVVEEQMCFMKSGIVQELDPDTVPRHTLKVDFCPLNTPKVLGIGAVAQPYIIFLYLETLLV